MSDFHLGIPNYENSLKREKKIVAFLDSIKENAKEIYFLGDVFDFWFEYKETVPKGFVRLLGKIAELSDHGIKIYYFKGNHDLWTFGYLKKELNITIINNSLIKRMKGKTFYFHHGDGLGPGDFGFKILKSVFKNRLSQFLFQWIHPDLGIKIAHFFARRSRVANKIKDDDFKKEQETQVKYCKVILKKQHIDYFILGHRHYPIEYTLNNKSKMINLGEWVNYNSYAVFDNDKVVLKYFKEN